MIDSVDRAIEKFKTHPSVLIIKGNISQENKFLFTEVSKSEIEKEIKNLNVEGALSGLRQSATESPLKVMKNAIYFTFKALFVLKIFKFLS